MQPTARTSPRIDRVHSGTTPTEGSTVTLKSAKPLTRDFCKCWFFDTPSPAEQAPGDGFEFRLGLEVEVWRDLRPRVWPQDGRG